ncbi:GntR family transcriptional regulator [Iodidimonas gelatinilytica]|uniref:GntR family transcriptional regulator n=1 Tax=Iodidimonas gelatinilytica TaxID=1236966 RepID=A0A5A7MS68_9PROT|nr:GntR family transcriptional regulator [Iodidimonas gelatinilytica]GEQ98484.1 GntR family transcriptional regulator [Iodidimonas gelatinilytica]
MSKASEKAYRELRERLLRGEFTPGDRLVEDELATLCGVSRTPIREALQKLANDMFVQQIPNRGTYVMEISETDQEDLFELRAVLEGVAAARAAKNADEETLALLDKQVARIDEALSDSDGYQLDTFLDANRRIHSLIIDMAGSARLRVFLQNLTEQPVLIGTLQRYSMANLKRSNEHHREIVEALRAGDSSWAQSVMVSHIHAALHSFNREK